MSAWIFVVPEKKRVLYPSSPLAEPRWALRERSMGWMRTGVWLHAPDSSRGSKYPERNETVGVSRHIGGPCFRSLTMSPGRPRATWSSSWSRGDKSPDVCTLLSCHLGALGASSSPDRNYSWRKFTQEVDWGAFLPAEWGLEREFRWHSCCRQGASLVAQW